MTNETHPLDMPLSGLRLVEASAGTGKTFTLAGLYLRLLIEKRLEVRDILVMTFTRAATQELRERIRARLARAAEIANDKSLVDESNPEDAITLKLLEASQEESIAPRLAEAAARMDEATITTIHGFSQMAVAENAFESGIAFDRGEQTEDQPLLEEAVTDYWRRQVIGGENTALLELWPTPNDCLNALKPVLKKPGIPIAGPDPASIQDSAAKAIKGWDSNRDTLQAFLEKTFQADEFTAKGKLRQQIDAAGSVSALIQDIDECVQNGPVHHEALQYLSTEPTSNQLRGKARKEGVPEEAASAVDQLLDSITQIPVARTNEAAREIAAGMDRIKQERRLFSFDDMIRALHEAITDKEKGPALADALRRRWPWAMVDEFQDTDPGQYAILKAIYASQSATEANGLIMIGDPKQAIYAFRGGDVFAYLQAAEDAQATYSLNRNFRSSGPLLSAIDTVFRTPKERPFVIDDIEFHSVDAGRAENDWWIEREGQPVPAMTLWTVEGDDDGKALNKGEAMQQLQGHCITEIASLLSRGQRHEDGQSRPLEARDICVLVNTNHQAVRLQAALSRQGIPAACLHQDAVFSSEQALQLLRLLRAAATPVDSRRVKAALTGELFGWRLGQLIDLARDENRWQECYGLFQTAHQRWEDNGVLAMLEPLIQKASARLLRRVDGERRMTNWLHLAELAQAAEAESFGMSGLIRWLSEQIKDSKDGNGNTGEAAQLRLESDENLVRITTIYKAKGLQWPVVMLPFLPELGTTGTHHNKPGTPPFEYHDKDYQAKLELRAPPPPANAGQAIRERKAEGLRLLYVALTRAEQTLYAASGHINKAHNGALNWLLLQSAGCPDIGWPSPKEAETYFNAGTLASAHASLEKRGKGSIKVVPVTPQSLAAVQLPAVEQPLGDARSDFPSRRRVWRMLSFSALVRDDRHGMGTRSGADDEAELDLDTEQERREANRRCDPVLDQLTGPGFGTAVHDVLENTDFARWPDPASAINEEQAETIRRQLRRQGIGFDRDKDKEQVVAAIGRLVSNSLQSPLPDIGPLARLPRDRMLAEMPFTLRLGGQTAQAVIERLKAHGYDSALSPDHRGQVLNGLMQGFIDLIVERDGRYWVIDYKTNRLGDYLDDYRPERLRDAIRMGHYDLQYLIYLTALHRHLTLCLPDYDPDRHLGGVQYLFLRGMNGEDANTGIFRDRPPSALIRALDALFDGKEVTS